MIYALCNVETGELLQLSEVNITASGHPLQVRTLDREMPDFSRVEWSKSTLDFFDKPMKRLTKLEYMNRFEDNELAAIYTAAKSIIQIEIWLEKFKLATEIDLTDPRTIGGVQALEAAGLIGQGRSLEILA
jgi:hypothetical protein